MNLRIVNSIIPLTVAVGVGWIGGSLSQGPRTAQAQTAASGLAPTRPPISDPASTAPLGPMGGVVKWNFPDSMDAVNAAPKDHRVLYEDDHIRLLAVIIQPGETENMHGHKYPSVFFRDTVRPKQYNRRLGPDGKPDENKTEQPRRGEDDVFPTAFNMTTGQAPHQTTITDTFPDMFYRVEFKRLLGKSIEGMTYYPYPPYPKN